MDDGDSHTNPFDEVPDWYKGSDPSNDPVAPLQGATGPSHSRPETTGSSLPFLALMAMLAIGGIGLLYMFVLASDDADSEPGTNLAFSDTAGFELEAGDCFDDVTADIFSGIRLTKAECDGNEWGRVPASFVADAAQPFLPFDEDVLLANLGRCASFIHAGATAIPMFVADNEDEWLAGERTVVCGLVLDDKEDEVVNKLNELTEDLDELAEELGIQS